MSAVGKILVMAGLVMVAVGVLLVFSDRVPWLGRLPGDIFVRKGNFTFYFPLATSIIISIVLSIIFMFLRK